MRRAIQRMTKAAGQRRCFRRRHRRSVKAISGKIDSRLVEEKRKAMR